MCTLYLWKFNAVIYNMYLYYIDHQKQLKWELDNTSANQMISGGS